jgi:hypothetical protein
VLSNGGMVSIFFFLGVKDFEGFLRVLSFPVMLFRNNARRRGTVRTRAREAGTVRTRAREAGTVRTRDRRSGTVRSNAQRFR